MRPWSCVLCSPLVLALCLLWVRAPPAGQQAVFTRVRGGPAVAGQLTGVARGFAETPVAVCPHSVGYLPPQCAVSNWLEYYGADVCSLNLEPRALVTSPLSGFPWRRGNEAWSPRPVHLLRKQVPAMSS